MNTNEIAHDTIRILEKGYYHSPRGKKVDLTEAHHRCLDRTECYQPEELENIRKEIVGRPAPKGQKTVFDVKNETTLQGCRRLIEESKYANIAALNFASAKHPGGGFLKGAKAQEESLARSSGLYFSLRQCPDYYEFHRSQNTSLYSDRMIYSPDCPVFRKDDGTLLDKFYTVDVLTSPAPNAGAIRQNEPDNIKKIEPVLHERSAKILSLALHQGCDALILGGWGCGVFKNDPKTVANIFRRHLGPKQPFWNRFRLVLFSILDTTPFERIINPFRIHFLSKTVD